MKKQKTKTKPQETLEFKLKKQVGTFAFNPPINLSEEGNWVLAVISFEATNNVCIITDGDNSFSITPPKRLVPEGGQELINEINEILELRSQNDFELFV